MEGGLREEGGNIAIEAHHTLAVLINVFQYHIIHLSL